MYKNKLVTDVTYDAVQRSMLGYLARSCGCLGQVTAPWMNILVVMEVKTLAYFNNGVFLPANRYHYKKYWMSFFFYLLAFSQFCGPLFEGDVLALSVLSCGHFSGRATV
jgi:hypothetical protein